MAEQGTIATAFQSVPAGGTVQPGTEAGTAAARETAPTKLAARMSDADFAKLPAHEQAAYQRQRAAEVEAAGGEGAEVATGDGDQPGTNDAPKVLKVGEVEVTETELRDLMTRDAAEKSRRATLPANPADYKLELPKTFAVPDGIKFEFKPEDPFLGPAIEQARQFAHRRGLDQEAFSEMLALYAGAQAHEKITLQRAFNAERDKLGASGAARVDAVAQWLEGIMGTECAHVHRMTMTTERHVRGFEALMRRMTNQGGAPFSQSGRDVRDPGKISQEEYDRMGPGERLDYARGHDQSRMPAWQPGGHG